MKLDKDRFVQFWNLFVEEAKVSDCPEPERGPMEISNGVSPHLVAAILHSANRTQPYPDCLNENWI